MNEYYVYTLRHPDGLVFYVGRGKGNYWNLHEQKAKRGERCRLTSMIQEIWNQGQQVLKRKEIENISQEEAYAYQVELYATYKAENPEMRYLGSHPRPIGHGKHIAESRMAKEYTHSPETRAKIRIKKSGVTYSEETKQKHREHYPHDRINSPEAVAKRDAKRRGAKRTPEMRARMSASAKKRYEHLSEAEKLFFLQPWIEAGQIASERVTRDTKLEILVEETLKASGVPYEKQYQVYPYYGDFYIPSTNIIIEVNGCFIHQCPICGWSNHRTEEVHAKDARKKAFLESKGYIVKVIWEHEIEGHKTRLPKKKE